MSPADAKTATVTQLDDVFFAGLIISAFLSGPLLNLLNPMFAAGMMAHLHKMIVAKGGDRV